MGLICIKLYVAAGGSCSFYQILVFFLKVEAVNTETKVFREMNDYDKKVD